VTRLLCVSATALALSLTAAQPASAAFGFLTMWGSEGAGDGQFNDPRAVTTDAAGNVYVADTINNRIQKFSSTGAFLLKWGTEGSGDGQFVHPQGVAVDAAGNVYVSDTNNNRIQKFDSAGRFLLKWGTAGFDPGDLISPMRLATDAAGSVYVADTGNARVQKFDPGGGFQGMFGSDGSGDGQFETPHGVALDGAGNIYVADSFNHRVQSFSQSFAFLGKWGSEGSGDGQFRNPYSLAIDSAGNVWVGDTFNHRIQIFDSAGRFLAKFGTSAANHAAPCGGEFNQPHGIAIDGVGNVYVADTGFRRIQKFGEGGSPIPSCGLPSPVLGKSVNVFVRRGQVLVRVPSGTFVPLREARQIPVGSVLDTRRGTVGLVSARDTRGGTQSGDFAAGVFQVLQSSRASARGLTELRLKGASFRGCRPRHSQATLARHRLSRRTIRRLRSNASGRFRTRGRFSAATVRGTVWLTADRCDGTLTKVSRGRVAVRDFRRRKTITVRAGRSYLARARR
jgi:DNA-binding beta-propeller fold protein YncE